MPLSVLRRTPARAAAAALAAAATALPLVSLAPVADAAQAPVAAQSLDARRVDRVPAPTLDWFSCFDGGECATAKLPLDYDDPTGPTTEVAIGRLRAADPAKRIGTLFVNPGGPGGSAVELAVGSKFFISQSVLDRFDIVGIDPRGIGYSDQLRCFENSGAQSVGLKGLASSFPVSAKEETLHVNASRRFGIACGSSGQPLASSMSTAEVARDMDVIRRTLGDSKLTFLGFSYGTQLGQVYANMFPDRVRAVVIDGVLDPVGWAGTEATKSRPVTDRILSADGASKAFTEFLRRCDKAGTACSFSSGDPAAKFADLADRLRPGPITISDPDFGTFKLRYSEFIGSILGGLYNARVGEDLVNYIEQTYTLATPAAGAPAADRAAMLKSVSAFMSAQRAKANANTFGFPYNNGAEAFTTVLCSDSKNPAFATQWKGWAVKADARAPYFGRAWLWASSPCASGTWGAVDEDAWFGPFTNRTVNPVLVVGNYYDPATNYAGAVAASRLLPNSRLLTSDSWGHTAYGTSACATDAIDTYLLSSTLPAEGTVCVGDSQPFAAAGAVRGATKGQGKPAPITPFVPGLTGTSD